MKIKRHVFQHRYANITTLSFNKLVMLVVMIVGVWPNTVSANVRFCNRTSRKAFVAIAYVEKDAPGTSTGGDKAVTVEGWWSVEPNQCEVVSDIHAGNHWVYYYAHAADSVWEGNALLCVSSGRFEISARFKRQGDRCPAGYRLEGFQRMNTNAKNHTFNLNP